LTLFALCCYKLDISATDIIATLSETVESYTETPAGNSTKQPSMESLKHFIR